MNDKTENQDLKCYSWQEIGLLYAKELSPESASRRIRRWVAHFPKLINKLTEAGWEKGQKLLTPIQAQILFNHFGEP